MNLKEAIAITVIQKDELNIGKSDSNKKKKTQVSPKVTRMITRSKNTTPNKITTCKEQEKENIKQI